MIITLSGSAPPTDQIRDQIRGLIASGRLAADQRLPSVRQLAKDLGVAPGTVAKAYKALEAERYLTARTGGGTRVSRSAATTPRPVLDAANYLATTSTRVGTSLDDTIRILRAIWPDGEGDRTVAPHSAISVERGSAATRAAAGIWARATARRDQLLTVPPIEDKLPGIEAAVAADGASLFICRVGGEAQAFAIVVPRTDVHEVLYLAVDPNVWGAGLARQLLDRLREHSVNEHISMELWVIEDNDRAIMTYERAGWTRTDDVAIRNAAGRPERRYTFSS